MSSDGGAVLEAVPSAPVLDRVRGQPRALALLRGSLRAPVHAYLFRGPNGAGELDAALCFAAALVCPNRGCGTCSSCRAVLARRHEDVTVFERSGAAITKDEARAIVTRSQRTPRSARYQVLVLTDFHLVEDAAPVLLKALEETPPTTVFLILCESVPPSLVTIASRCVEVGFHHVDLDTISEVLVLEEIPPDLARSVALSSGGSLDRARLLAADPGLSARQELWRTVPDRLDGKGSTVVRLARELVESSSELVEVLVARQRHELDSLAQAAERAGERRLPGRAVLEERHKREQRRVRADELRAGLARLSETYRAKMTAPKLSPRRLAGLLEACGFVDDAARVLVRNPNEMLLIEHLLLRLDGLG